MQGSQPRRHALDLVPSPSLERWRRNLRRVGAASLRGQWSARPPIMMAPPEADFDFLPFFCFVLFTNYKSILLLLVGRYFFQSKLLACRRKQCTCKRWWMCHGVLRFHSSCRSPTEPRLFLFFPSADFGFAALCVCLPCLSLERTSSSCRIKSSSSSP